MPACGALPYLQNVADDLYRDVLHTKTGKLIYIEPFTARGLRNVLEQVLMRGNLERAWSGHVASWQKQNGC